MWLAVRFRLSQRRVCRLLALDRNTLRYRSRRQEDAALRTRIREIAEPVWLSADLCAVTTGRLAGEPQEGGAGILSRRRTVVTATTAEKGCGGSTNCLGEAHAPRTLLCNGLCP